MSARESTAAAKMSDPQFRKHALGILERELGPEGLARFLRVYRKGKGDYTRDRKDWLGKATVREISSQLGRRNPKSA
jgi:hypothetical protein